MTGDGGLGTYLPAEQQARVAIDAQLASAGWIVQDADAVNLTAGQGVAVREFILEKGHGRADYLLFIDGAAVGAIEAKPAGTTLTGVELNRALLELHMRVAARLGLHLGVGRRLLRVR